VLNFCLLHAVFLKFYQYPSRQSKTLLLLENTKDFWSGSSSLETLSLLFHHSSTQEQHHLKVWQRVCAKIKKWQAKYPLNFTQTAEKPEAKV